ncbi:MAG: DNRLRE domain-containing protein [Propionibacteriales bacterium]|nr:DNRLRE domain-containing protein [Propionibacteriales bacterium]
MAASANGSRVEDLSQRTEDTRVFAEADGTWTSEVASGPERVKDSAGDWHDIDTTLVARDGAIAPKWSTTDVEFSDGGDTALATLTVPAWRSTNGRDLQWRWATDLPEPVLDGPTATYQGAVDVDGPEHDGALGDLVVTATAVGFTHAIVLHEAPAEPENVKFELPVVLTGAGQANVTTTAQGGVEVTLPDAVATHVDRPSVIGAPPIAWDSSTDGTAHAPDPGKEWAPEGAQVSDVEASISASSSGVPALTLTPDADWLADPDTVYPVVIDPSYTGFGVHDTWVASQTYTSGQSGSQELRAGTKDGGTTKARSFLIFSKSTWANTQINTATLSLYNFESNLSSSATTCNGFSIRANRISENWDAADVTWANQPEAVTYDEAVTGQVFGGGNTNVTCSDGYPHWDLTPMVAKWANNDLGVPNYGVRLAAATETNNASWRRYRSINFTGTNESHKPHLIVNYTPYPTAPAVGDMTMTPCADGCPSDYRIADTLTPTLRATTTDPQGDQLSYQWEVRDSTTLLAATFGTTSGVTASGTQASWTVPANTLSSGTLYQFRSGVKDATSPVQWSDWTDFGVSIPEPPAVPTGLAISPCSVEDCTGSVVQSLTPVLQASVDDNDSSLLRPSFEVRNSSGTVVASGDGEDVGPGGIATYEVAEGALSNSGSYEFRVAASDEEATTWSSWKSFSVSIPSSTEPPEALSLTSCTSRCAFWESTGEGATFAATVSSAAPTAGVTVKFEVRSGTYAKTGEVVQVSPGGTATWSLPVGEVSQGTHEVRAGVVDGTDVRWTGWYPFMTTVEPDTTIDVPVAQEAEVDAETEIVVTPPDPNADAEDTPPSTPYTDADLEQLDSQADSDVVMARAMGESADSEAVAGRYVSIPEKYAPVAYIHPDEDRMPMSAATFITHSTLEWAHSGCNDHDLSTRPSSTKMGRGEYSHQNYAFSCVNHSGTRWKTTDRVHPFKDGGPDGYGNGMNLDLDNSARDGFGFSGAEPVYYTYKPYDHIQYWFHWGESSIPNAGPNLGKHEGDWEHMAIKLDPKTNKPTHVKYFYHHDSCTLPFSRAPKGGLNGMHPKVWVAKSSHGNYPAGLTGGDQERVDFGWRDQIDGTGPKWYATRNLQNAKERLWYGYAGAWGEMGNSSKTTGPWGPNPYRLYSPNFAEKGCGS